MRVLAFLMVFFVLISPFYGIKKVKANPVAIGGSAIVALILSGLAAQGLISGEYKVTAAQLTQINDLAQAQLALEGATAVAAAQKLGDALAAGAESAKIKALATGGVIYAFLQAIQDTLFPKHDVSDIGISELYSPNFLLAQNADYLVYLSYYTEYFNGQPSFTFLGREGSVYYQRVNNVKKASYSSYAYGYSIYSVSENKWIKKHTTGINSLYAETLAYYNPGVLGITDYGYYNRMIVSSAEYQLLASILFGATYTDAATQIKDQASVIIPTVLPQTIINNINTWDGTSDLVLAPPLPYDVPDDESLVVDPTYGGEVIDPTDPVDPPAEEEGISLPWLSALLALLGLGKLTGIDEGVLSGIDSIVDGITSTIQDVIDGVKTTAGEWATAATAAITSAISGIQSGISSIADTISHAFDPPSKDIDWDKLKSSGSVIFTKFPFSIPADLKFLVGLLVSDPQAPKWTVTVPFSIVGDWAQDGEFVLDFSVIDGFMVIVRNIELLAFIFSMVYMTRQLIWK